ncbi:MAG: inorganic diphosphatase [Holophagales bacterium]|nr:inorganic diphosphatase [Holophagales bacterium]
MSRPGSRLRTFLVALTHEQADTRGPLGAPSPPLPAPPTEFCAQKTKREGIVGDGDPLDVCVLSEKAISHGDVLMDVIPIGGLRMLDNNEADDKIVAVLEGDAVFGQLREIYQLPPALVDRLKHYFLTYKQAPDSLQPHRVEITHVYGREEAHEVIRRSRADYDKRFGKLRELLTAALRA